MYCLSAICHFALEGCLRSSALLIHCSGFNTPPARRSLRRNQALLVTALHKMDTRVRCETRRGGREGIGPPRGCTHGPRPARRREGGRQLSLSLYVYMNIRIYSRVVTAPCYKSVAWVSRLERAWGAPRRRLRGEAEMCRAGSPDPRLPPYLRPPGAVSVTAPGRRPFASEVPRVSPVAPGLPVLLKGKKNSHSRGSCGREGLETGSLGSR